MIEHLFQIFICFTFGIVSGMLTLFIDFCIGEPHSLDVNKSRIFSKVGIWIFRNYERVENSIKEERERRVSEVANKSEYDAEELKRADAYSKVNYWKALGVCPICLNVWISFVCFGFCYYRFDLDLFYFVPFIVFSNYMLRLHFRL